MVFRLKYVPVIVCAVQLLCGSLYLLSAQTTDELRAALKAHFNQPYFDTASVSVSLINLSTGAEVFSLREKALHRPASNMKLLTSCAGLLFLGKDYTFYRYSGIDKYDTASGSAGSLYFRGGFDPEVTSSELLGFASDSALMQQWTGKPIKKITGNIIADLTEYGGEIYGNGWMWDDDFSTDQPALSAFTVDKNCITVALRYNDSLKAVEIKTTPETGYLKITSSVQPGEKTSFRITRLNDNPAGESILLSGFVAGNNKWYRETFPLQNPPLYYVTLLKEGFIKAGIPVAGKAQVINEPANYEVEITHSTPFKQVLNRLNKASDNLNAEMTLLALARKVDRFTPAVPERGLLLVDSLITLSSYKSGGYRAVDGSGVSHYNMVSAKMLTDILKYMYYAHPAEYEMLAESLPVAGTDGTLKGRMKGTPAENNVRAKTGTLSAVSSLSGYMKDKNGDLYCFSVMMENFPGSSSIARKYQDEFCVMVTSFGTGKK